MKLHLTLLSILAANIMAAQPGSPIPKEDSLYYFRRFHFYSGLQSPGTAESPHKKLFEKENYGTFTTVRHGDIFTGWCEHSMSSGAVYTRRASGAQMGFAYQLSPFLKAGIEFGSGSGSAFIGSKGDISTQWLTLSESVLGNGIAITSSYLFSKYRYITNPGVELSLKGDVQFNSYATSTEFSVLKIDSNSCAATSLHYAKTDEKSRSLSGGLALRADVFIGRVFSLYLEFSQTFLERAKVEAKTLSGHGETAYVPSHTVDFSKRTVTIGISFHFLNNVPYKNQGTPLFLW